MIFTLISMVAMVINAQNSKMLIADGTKYTPDKYALQPIIEKLSAEEIAEVKKEALREEFEFEADPQASLEETQFERDFELLDVAKGFIISREIEYKAFLYTAWSLTSKRNYQGILVLSRFKNVLGKRQSRVLAHYAYRYQGDKFIRKLADINRNGLDEIAVFSALSTKIIERRLLRIIEFSPAGIERFGFAEIFNRINHKQRDPWNKDGKKPAIRVYTPPDVKALKLFVKSDFGKQSLFFREEFEQIGDDWRKTEEFELLDLKPDSTKYAEIVKSIFVT